MEEIVRQTLLFDFYGELLTEHQQETYEAVVLNDIGYSEAAAQTGTSRQSVYDLIRRCDRQLNGYEEKLHLVERFLRIRKNTRQILALTREMRDDPGAKRIAALAQEVLEEL